MVRIGNARTVLSLLALAAALLPSCRDETTRSGPPPSGAELRVMAVAESYLEDGLPRADLTVVVTFGGVPVTDAVVTLNGAAIPWVDPGDWYRGLTLPFADSRTVTVGVVSASGNRTLTGTLPGEVTLRQPLSGASVPDDMPIPVAWDAVTWDGVPTSPAITLEYTQGNPFHFVTLPPEATGYEIPASVTGPSAMEFLVVEAWSGHADPGNLQRGDWLGQDGLRLGSRAVTWVQVVE
jgi:hypothetical protein